MKSTEIAARRRSLVHAIVNDKASKEDWEKFYRLSSIKVRKLLGRKFTRH